jgi:hypothetical protein
VPADKSPSGARPFARQLVTERLAEKGLTLEAFTAIFDRMVAVNAKSLVILMAQI